MSEDKEVYYSLNDFLDRALEELRDPNRYYKFSCQLSEKKGVREFEVSFEKRIADEGGFSPLFRYSFIEDYELKSNSPGEFFNGNLFEFRRMLRDRGLFFLTWEVGKVVSRQTLSLVAKSLDIH